MEKEIDIELEYLLSGEVGSAVLSGRRDGRGLPVLMADSLNLCKPISLKCKAQTLNPKPTLQT